MFDYLLVGFGLAGVCFAETAISDSKSILVINNELHPSTRVAAGLYNPVVLKRFTETWKAQEQINLLNNFYSSIENRLNIKIDFKLPIYRKLFSVEEQNNWFVSADKISLSSFLSPKLVCKKINSINSSYHYGEVKQTGYINLSLLLDSYISYLINKNAYISEPFDYASINFNSDYIEYKGFKARHVVFSEGFGMLNNPFFNQLPLDGTKGEILVIKALDLDLDVIVKTGIFILPLGSGLYKVGATYNWKDKTNEITEEGKVELVQKIREIISCDFEIVTHLAGVRPTVKDRRPLVGTHNIYKNIHLLNGLGTRGVMLGPYLAKALYDNIEHDIALDEEMDIVRFI